MQQIKYPMSVQMFGDSIANRKLIWKLAKNDFKTKYAGSYLGIVWAFVQPVVTILLYWFVFQVGFRSANVSEYPFVLWLTAGLVPWFFFSESWNGATNSMLDYSFLVKKVVFNIGILPPIKIISALAVNIFFTFFTIVMFSLMGYLPTLHILQILYCLACTIFLVLGLSYFTSAVVVFVRDLGHFLTVALQILMWLTPIMWDITMIEKDFPWLVKIMRLNPVYYIVQQYRNALFSGQWFWEDLPWTIYFWALAFVLYVFGVHVFQRLRPHFADVI